MTKLTPQEVQRLLMESLAVAGEEDETLVVAEGPVSTYRFHSGRVQARTEEIRALLAELPDGFRQTGGGGWSFLNACMDRHGNQWTGMHRVVEQLVCLGLAVGLAGWCMPRDMWSSLPGGMPYLWVNP